MLDIRTVTVMRYILPLREGGSLPALAEADDDFKYVLKFRGAGHGVKMLISELLGGKITEVLGLKIPELVFVNLDADFGRSEGDEEIQDLLKASEGLNLGLHFLSGAIAYDSTIKIDPLLASKIVWLDAFITNIDRTFKNTNLLMWHKELWIIDNGASFYFHHSWQNFDTAAKTPFKYVKDHVLLPQASMLDEANRFAKEKLNDDIFREIVNLIPEDWLHWNDTDETPEEIREVYFQFLKTRLENSEIFVNEAKNARG
ncbi:aminotransferase class I and II [Elizabethkingia anophelis]|nr:aminotransferase class I and II [Elizabethkingia anophelis]MDV3537564.1 aminotransferase class I and II [Elizabethkingia anophelis]MDV3947700.1 aminotransferase class I and II [Elizabethkingia anophelis]MDV3955286.1 aminotransferase class I and II [Elizabethkingia anophelis]